MKKVSIVIPTYNHCSDLLAPCIESIIKYTDLSDIEIIVVANGCTDNTREYLSDKPIKLVWFDEPIGYTKSTNEGIKAATGEYIILLNNDIELLEQNKNRWIDLLMEPFSDPSVGITGPMKITCPHAKRDFLIFFCVCIRKSMFDKYGLLDEIFSPGYGEDTDFCCRIEDAGHKVVQVCPSNQYADHEKKVMVGSFPLFHKGNETFRHEKWDEVIKRNSRVLEDRYLVKVNKALGCEGYMGDDEIKWLAREASKHKIIIEVGSWMGKSTRALGDNVKGVVYAVDHFNGSQAEEAQRLYAANENGDVVFIRFCQQNFDLIRSGKIIPLRGTADSMYTVLSQQGIKADMIFIDGGHTYEEVKHDVSLWQNLLTEDGLLCGHDARTWIGVDQAISEVLDRHYIGDNTSIWFCEKKDVKHKPAIYDCFIINDELDILAKRFMMLYDMVDRFVIVEGTKTFANKPKPLHFRDNLERFKPYLSKVSHVVVDDFPDPSPFGMENHQRDCIMRGLTNCRDNDTIIISDCDEIPAAPKILSYTTEQGIRFLEMDLYYYNMHVRAADKWRHVKILPYELLKKIGPGGARYAEKMGLNPGLITDGGVHLSFFGDANVAIKKMEEYSHQEYNTNEYKNPERIQKAIDDGKDIFGRSIQFIKSDKLTLDELGIKHGTQKCSLSHDFLLDYEAALHDKDIKTIVEIGIDQGSSLRMWAEFFPDADVWGLDIDKGRLINEGRIRSRLCDQSNPHQLRTIVGECGSPPDLIIDDGSHMWSHQISSYEALYPLLARGGVYIVEDLHTSMMLWFKDQEQKPLDYFDKLPNFAIVRTNNGRSLTGIGTKP